MADEAVPEPVVGYHRFTVTGLASPHYPLRTLGLFAQQDILPLSVDMQRSAAGIVIHIVDRELDEPRAAIILEKIRALPDTAVACLGR